MLQKTVDYITNRASRGVRIYITDLTEGNDAAFYNTSLMEWVFENLLKNALDAMDGKGDIRMLVQVQNDNLIIDVKDSGKGIPANKFQAVFEPGFTTKKRGWGLGLTLTKRIVEQYHNGKIFVKESSPGQGTTFRIMLRMKP
jgi:signal transduction histidine kinase